MLLVARRSIAALAVEKAGLAFTNVRTLVVLVVASRLIPTAKGRLLRPVPATST